MPIVYTAGNVMDDASVLLNDSEQAIFDYTAQLPFLKMVLRDLDQEFTLNESPINIISEAEISVLAGATALSLPTSFFLPISLLEKGSSDTYFTPMKERPDVGTLQYQQTATLGYWDYRHNDINLLGALVDRTVKLIYWRQITEFVDEDSLGEIGGARNVLAYRTAAMCAQYIGGNVARAQALNGDAAIALDRLLALTVKNNQGNRVRRRPFRSSGYSQTRTR